MVDSYLGEIRLLPFNWAPQGWMLCDGRALSQDSYQSLFALLGGIYGSNAAAKTFNLPDLRGRTPMGQSFGGGNDMPVGEFGGGNDMPVGEFGGGNDMPVGEFGGSETVTIADVHQMPAHSHALMASTTTGSSANVAGAIFAAVGTSPNANPAPPVYGPVSAPVMLAANTISSAGNTQPHENMQPFLVLNYMICVAGLFPSRP